ncbi:MAG TPA: thioesterase family protein [Saprospiraceae bacterium]|nr:thioesterase family protein [Saprospiraceae bacterium]HQW56186.1 thioesterase family protein [Saprospiraceae bacterium]
MFTHQTSLRVRYADTDQMGYVYYGNYAQYYEVGRVEAMRSLGITYAWMEKEMATMMPVMNANFEYLRPAFYDELLTIETNIPLIPENEIIFESQIFNGNNKVVNKGMIRLCFVDIKTKKRINIPSALLDKLISHYD